MLGLARDIGLCEILQVGTHRRVDGSGLERGDTLGRGGERCTFADIGLRLEPPAARAGGEGHEHREADGEAGDVHGLIPAQAGGPVNAP